MKTKLIYIPFMWISLFLPNSTFGAIQISCPRDLDLGLNPREIPEPNIDDIKVRNSCRDKNVSVKHVDDFYVYDGCIVKIERTYSATNRCGERDECTQTIVYVIDKDPPIIVCGIITDLGCNPDMDLNSRSGSR